MNQSNPHFTLNRNHISKKLDLILKEGPRSFVIGYYSEEKKNNFQPITCIFKDMPYAKEMARLFFKSNKLLQCVEEYHDKLASDNHDGLTFKNARALLEEISM